MSKGKKGNKATPEAVSWDEGLLNATVEEDDWRPYLVLVCPNSPDDEPHVRTLVGAVGSGTRRRFSVLDKTSILESAAEDVKLAQAAGGGGGGGGKKSKAAAAPTAQRPMFVEVCEQVVEAMKSSDPLPPSLVAKMIKYKVLREKAAHHAAIAQKEAEEEARAQATKKGGEGKGGGKGGGGKAGKKGKETPATDAGPAIPLPERPPVNMKRRGEEDTDSKYIDDEPADGPTHYFIMTGFSSLDLVEQLAPVGLTAHVLMNVSGGSPPPNTQSTDEGEGEEERREEREKLERDLEQFWGRVGQCVQATRDGHMLRDMARVGLSVPQPLVPDGDDEGKELYGQSVFDAVSQRVYGVLEQREQYQHYLNYLRLRQLSPPSGAGGREPSPVVGDPHSQTSVPTQLSASSPVEGGDSPPSADLRLYTDLLSSVPPQATTIPLILHCMVEQVASNLTAADEAGHTTGEPAMHSDVLAEITNCISGLCIPTTAKRGLLPSTSKEVSHLTGERASTHTIEHWDKMELLTHNLTDSNLLSVRSSQINTNDRAHLVRVLVPPKIDAEEGNAHLAMLHSLQHHCTSSDISEQLLTHSLITLSLEHLTLPSATSLPDLDCNTHPLLFDFPLDISTRERKMADGISSAVVPYSGNSASRARVERKFELCVPQPQLSLVDHSVCEPMSRGSLLQLLQSLRHTHPYISTFTHRLSGCTVVVAHSGFQGGSLYTHTWQSLAHSRVGFDNYLRHVAQRCGAEIDRAVEEDRERRERFEEEARRREIEQREAQKKEEEEEEGGGRVSAKGGKNSSASNSKKTPTGKKSKLDATCPTLEPDTTPDLEAGLPEFEERQLYEAYDVGDSVLLDEGTVSVQFLSDGTQVCTEKTERFGADAMITVSALSNGHIVSCSSTRAETVCTAENTQSEKNEKEIDETVQSTDEGEPPAVIIAGVPKPPPRIKTSSLTAQFRDSLHVSLSHFGPRGSGELPFQPEKPAVLLESTNEGAPSSESRPQSRQTPQKLSKKQMEQQQQLLEQQRQVEEQRRREREEAQADYDTRRSALERQNKYQQLFASTPYGLHVHVQISVDIDADPTLTDGSDGTAVVRQSYTTQSSGEHVPSLSLTSEVERYYLPDGSVLRFMRDDSISVLCPDGHIFHTATHSLTHLYHQQINGSDNRGNPDAQNEAENQKNGDLSRPPLQQAYSDTKVTFADNIKAVQTERFSWRDLSRVVWVVTAPSGERYLWKHHQTVSEPTQESVEKAEGESEGGGPTGEADQTAEQQQQEKEEEGREGEDKVATVVPLPPAQVVSATDPVTKQVLISREDNVTLLQCQDGSFVAQHSDGTRITTTLSSSSSSSLPEIMVECPGFARVTHNATQSRQCLVEFPDGSQVLASTNGSYSVEREGEYCLKVDSSGTSRCQLQLTEPGAYEFSVDHTGTGNILVAKNKKSRDKVSVGRDGVPSVSSSSSTLPPHPSFSPRYFVVPSQGLPYRILSKTELDEVISAAEGEPGTTLVRGEPVPGFEGTTVAVMKPLREENPAIMPYKNGSIVPKNLSLAHAVERGESRTNGRKRFGVGVGKSLHILPITPPEVDSEKRSEAARAIECRQFVIFDQFDETMHGKILSGLTRYISWREQERQREDDLLPVDSREPSEQTTAQDLKAEWLARNILSQALQELNQQQHQETSSECVTSDKEVVGVEGPPITLLGGVRRDLEQAEQDRTALLHHTVPQYFDSDQGQQFLRMQSPDMTTLAKQLAQPRILPPGDPSHSSTPSSLQSASIVLRPLGGANSPDVGDIDTVSVGSASKIRPAHPTPDHARGLGSPTDVRPKNPTPFRADRLAPSPAFSIISRPGGETPLVIGGGAREESGPTPLSEEEEVGERSVSFVLPPRRPSLIVGESSPDDPDQQGPPQTKPTSSHTNKLTSEDPTQHQLRTCCKTQPTRGGGGGGGRVRGLEGLPECLEFGTVREGCLYARSLVLKNVGIDPCRFRIKQPPPSTGIRVIYTPGPVAAGMTRRCEVELFAIAVGVVGRSGTGHISHNLEVVSEANTLLVPVHAAVLTDSENQAQQSPLPPAVGVRHIVRPSSSREDLTRPRATGTN